MPVIFLFFLHEYGNALTDLNVPVAGHRGLPGADVGVASQHFEGRRLSSPIDSQEAEALTGQKETGPVNARTRSAETLARPRRQRERRTADIPAHL